MVHKTKREDGGAGEVGMGWGNKTQTVNFAKHKAAGGEVFSMNLKTKQKTGTVN